MKDLDTMVFKSGLGMCNLGHTIDSGVEKFLKETPNSYIQHSAWNFHGYVWFEAGKFTEQVWRYKFPQTEISAETLEALMEAVNSEFGME